MADNAPPSSFQAFASLNCPSSTGPSVQASSSVKDRRRSLQIVSPGPRPLQLASVTLLGSNPSSACSSPIPSTSRAHTPLTGTDGIESRSPIHSSSPVTPVSLNGSSSRRQSSISYFSSNRPSGHEHDSLRSPLSARSGGLSDRPGLSRSNSLGAGAGRAPRSPALAQTGRTNSESKATDGDGRERPPLTLADKHAELLQFIAQKEAKCLELRSQLATHEAELLQLKKKWERIVNRGLNSTSNTSPSSSPPNPNDPSSSSVTSAHPPAGGSSIYPYLSSAQAGANGQSTGSAVVIEGIKEGVQGVSRLIAAGLGSITQAGGYDAPEETPATTRKLSRDHVPHPLQLGSSNWKVNRHAQKESQSSTSTSTTGRTGLTSRSNTPSARSSMTSNYSISKDDETGYSTSTADGKESNSGSASILTEEEKAESEFGDFEEATSTQPIVSSSKESSSPEQVLMVRDTGATPTMSPNPDFHSRKQAAAAPQAEKPADADNFPTDFDWDDDAWDNPSPPAPNNSQQATRSSLSAASPPQSTRPSSTVTSPKPPPSKPRDLPGVSSIPGLGSVGVLPGAPSSWVGSVGKKLGEIQKSSTFTKSQKRASLLLSDVSQSIASVLNSPSPLTPASTRSTSSPLSPLASKPSNLSNVSLLDDDDDGDDTVRMTLGSPIMLPNSQKPSNGMTLLSRSNSRNSTTAPTKENKKTAADADEDEWNW